MATRINYEDKKKLWLPIMALSENFVQDKEDCIAYTERLEQYFQADAAEKQYNFNMRSQKEGETISAFMASLRRLSEHCKFEAIQELQAKARHRRLKLYSSPAL